MNLFLREEHNSKEKAFIKLICLFIVALLGIFGSIFFVNMDITTKINEMSVVFDTATKIQTTDVLAKGEILSVHRPLPIPKSSIQIGSEFILTAQETMSPRRMAPELVGTLIATSTFSADTIMVKDVGSQTVIFTKNESSLHPLASITKLLTALTLLDKIEKWDDNVVVVDVPTPETNVYQGEKFVLIDLWSVMLVGSSNRATRSIVQHLYSDEAVFVDEMNKKAQEIGLSNSNFVESTGLDERNTATAKDALILLDEALKNEKIADFLNKKEVTITENTTGKIRKIQSTNSLLLGLVSSNFTKIIGGKTGFTNAAGYNYTMRIEGDNGVLLDVVVMGTNSKDARFAEARDVIENVLLNYRWDNTEGEILDVDIR